MQSKIVDHVGKLRDEISILRKRAQAMRTEALIEFENEIFE